MNEPTHQHKTLQDLLADALSPLPVTDAHIDQLDEREFQSTTDERQLQRINDALTQLRQPNESDVRLVSVRSTVRLVRVPSGPAGRQSEKQHLRRQNPHRRGAVAALIVSTLSLLGVLLFTSEESVRQQQRASAHAKQQQREIQTLQQDWMIAQAITPVAANRVTMGDVITTKAQERRRVSLPDGSVLYVNESSAVTVTARRRVTVSRGEVFVEVVPQFDRDAQRELFEIVTPTRTVIALGTKFGVDASDSKTEVLVTQGKVKVSDVDDPVEAGQVLAKRTPKIGKPHVVPAVRASERLSWTRDLMSAASAALVPTSEHAGGSLISIDPNGQEMKLSLRKYHVDVHIEDGFARTTIDQTYFNHTQQRLEGTFHFPLPPDASLSRLAMYVGSKLMEGGMAERQHARNTFEKIVHKMQDPALLEWVDGTTFKMRVFPLEARQEKRIVLSYTQRLNSAYGKTYYRFPAGHNMDVVRAWSVGIRVKDGAAHAWHSPSHELTATVDDRDLVLSGAEQHGHMGRDVVVELEDEADADGGTAGTKWTSAQHDGHQYLMLRYRPELPGKMKRTPRHWVFLFEAAADRNSLLARTQIEVLRTLLDNAEHTDTFHIVTANTDCRRFDDDARTCSMENISEAIKHLEQTHLIGALNLEKALRATVKLADSDEDSERENVIVHLGSAIPVLGEQDQHPLLELLTDSGAAYVGVGVGKRWSQSFMKEAASRTGGYFTQVNPDEEVQWRAFELSSALNTPRLLNVGVQQKADNGKPQAEEEWLNFTDTVIQGEEICAVMRIASNQKLPRSVTVTGILNGQPWKQTVKVRNVANGANYLPRTWAKLEIDRLIADSAGEHKDEIIRLSKTMYVMSPFTSLLVLENEEMYTQYNIDRGRKDHWALYPCPDEIKVVHEPIERREELVLEQKEPPVDWSSTVRRFGRSDLRFAQECLSASGFASQIRRSVLLSDGHPGPVASMPTDIGRIVMPLPRRATGLYEPRDSLAQFFAPPTEYFDDGWSVNLSRDFVTNINGRPTAFDVNLRSLISHEVGTDFSPQGSSFFAQSESSDRYDRNGHGVIDFGSSLYNSYHSDLYFEYDNNGDGIREGIWIDADPYSLSYGAPNARHWSMMTPQIRFEDEEPVIIPSFHREVWTAAPVNNSVHFTVPNFGDMAGGIDRSARFRILDQLTAFNRQHNSDFDEAAAPSEYAFRMQAAVPDLDTEMGSMTLGPFYPYSAPVASWEQMAQVWPSYGSWPNGASISYAMTTSTIPLAWSQVPLEWDDGVWRLDFSGQPGGLWMDGVWVDHVAAMYPDSISDERPIAYPDAKTWQSLVRRRYRAQPHASLSQTVSVNRQNTPLWHVLQRLSFATGLKVSVHPALANRQVTLRVNGMQLRSALELLIDQVNGTYHVTGNGIMIVPKIDVGPVSTDLITHAPALNTSRADVLAIAESELPRDRRLTPGEVDEAARKLIERARSRGWERITFPADDDRHAFSVLCDGAGRYMYDRIVSEGLHEHVVCDGNTLFHVYADIGLASRRSYSRFHRQAINSVVPWLLPPVGELSLGADLRLKDDNVVVISTPSESEQQAETPDESSEEESTVSTTPQLETHLVFAENGGLAEQRHVDSTSQKIMWRTVYEASGQVRLLDEDGNEIATVNLRREAAAAPDLKIDDEELVVLPMPIRSSEFLRKKTATDAEDKMDSLTEQQLLALVLAYSAEEKGADVAKLVYQQFFSKGDYRDGLYVLLSRFPRSLTWEENSADKEAEKRKIDLRPSAEGSPLRQFLRQVVSLATSTDTGSWAFDIDGADDGFVQQLATAWNIHHRWSTGAAVKDRTQAQIRKELTEAIDYVAECRTDALGWRLLSAIQPHIEARELHDLFATAAERFENHPLRALLVRQERVRALFKAGKQKRARRLYAQLIVAVSRRGVMPRIDAEIRALFLKKDGREEWNKLVTDCGAAFVEAGLLRTALGLSAQLQKLGDLRQAADILDDVLEHATAETRPDVVLAAAEHLRRLSDDRADELLTDLLELDRLQEDPSFWRYAAQVAEDLGHKQVTLRRLEQAAHLEFIHRPKLVDVEKLRQTYTNLMARYEAVIDAAATLETQVPHDLYARIVRAADQWRLMEDDPTTCCHTTASLLSKLGYKDLSWSYLTTPLAGRSGESAPWTTLAENLTQRKQIRLADLAWTRAFKCEQTNPDILLSHAKMLRSAGRHGKSNRLLRQIVDATWQPRFSKTQQQARSQLAQTDTGEQ